VFLVSTADGQALALRDLGQAGVRLLAGTEEASSPAFSPDGESIAFFALGRLWRLPVGGGPATVLAEAPGDNRGLSWSPDGYLYAAPDSALPLKRVPETGGAFATVVELDAARRERTHRWPHVLPGGAVLFTSDTSETTEYYDDARIEAVRPATGERRVLVEQASRARYLPSGHLVFARGGSLFAVPFDEESLETRGTPAIVLQGVSTTVSSGAAHFALAGNGTLLYVGGEPRRGSSIPQWVSREGAVEPSGIAEAFHDQLSLAPDGRQAAIVTAQGTGSDVWIADTERGTSTRLTFDNTSSDVVWSRDGRWVAYRSGGALYRKRADGGGEAELLWRGANVRAECFGPGDRELIFSQSTEGQSDLWLVPIGAPGEARQLVASPNDDTMAELSPDGRWLAFTSLETGRPEVFVVPFPAAKGKWQVSTAGGFEPRWSRDGRELFYRDGNGSLLRIEVDPGEAFVAGARQRLFGGMRTGDNPHSYGIGPDGARFLTLGLTVEQAVDRVNLVFGWDREVARILAPRR
jgi:serine/threonine-protein kinase